MSSYKTVIDGIAVEIYERESETRKHIMVTDLLTGEQFVSDYPKSFDWAEVVEIAMSAAIDSGRM